MCKRFGGLYDQTKDKRESFKFWFLEQYCGPDKQYEWNRQLRKLSQQAGETVSSYATKLTDLYFRADPQRKYPENDMLNQFIEGLRDELRVQVRIMQPRNLQEAINKAKAVEMALSDGRPLASYSLIGDTGVKKDLAEIKALLTLTGNETCNLCYNGKHKTEDCPERSINRINSAYYQSNNNRNNNQLDKNTCYGCGQKGHMKKDCPSACRNCGKIGHKAAQCRSQSRLSQRNNNQNSTPWNQRNKDNRNSYNNNNNRNQNYNKNNNQQNRNNQSNQNKKNYYTEQEQIDQQEALAQQMAELTKAIQNLN